MYIDRLYVRSVQLASWEEELPWKSRETILVGKSNAITVSSLDIIDEIGPKAKAREEPRRYRGDACSTV